MAGLSSRIFFADEALDLITAGDSIEEGECFEDIFEGSDDKFKPVSDYINFTTGETLLSDNLLSSSSASLILRVNSDPNAAEMDSLLSYDLDCVDGEGINT